VRTGKKPQVPPLRYATVGMTLLLLCWGLVRRIWEGRGAHRGSLGFARDDKGKGGTSHEEWFLVQSLVFRIGHHQRSWLNRFPSK
jgi:hypothetical protein